MGGASYPAGVTSIYGETLELSTILASLGIPGMETKQAIICNSNYDFRLHINPAILEIIFYDASASAGARFVKTGTTASLTRDLTDRSSVGSGTILDAATSSDRLYIRLADIIGGLHVKMTASVNTAARTLTANYWNGSAWTDISATDDTKKETASLGKSGDITWTAPSDWMQTHLGGNVFDGSVMGMSITDKDAPGTYGFWLQLLWSGAFSADVEIQDIWTLNRNTNRAYFHGGIEYPISFDRRVTGAIEAILDINKMPDSLATDELEINWLRTVI